MCQRGIDKMSLCYDFEKSIMVTLALVAISLSVGLLMQAHGTELTNSTELTNRVINASSVQVEGSFIANGTSGTQYTCHSLDGTFGHIECSPIIK